MINLMPPAEQKEIRAARSNALLIRYIILLAAALVFLLGAMAVSYLTLSQSSKQAIELRLENEKKATGYTETQAMADKLRSDLSSAKNIFESEILYSKLLVRFSALLPEGAAIQSFQIDETSLAQPINLTVGIRDRATAETLLQNFNSSPYVTGASLGNVNTNTESAQFPYTAQLDFTFNRSIAQ